MVGSSSMPSRFNEDGGNNVGENSKHEGQVFVKTHWKGHPEAPDASPFVWLEKWFIFGTGFLLPQAQIIGRFVVAATGAAAFMRSFAVAVIVV